MDENIIFILEDFNRNKFEVPVGEKEPPREVPMTEFGFIFVDWCDVSWRTNYKDDGEYFLLGEAIVDDDDDFYGGTFMIGDIWEDE